MKFAHLADCHIGSWRDPKLNNISLQAFQKAIDLAASKKVDFIIVSGDLFNTSLPAIDKLKAVTKKLKEIKDKGIPFYIIAGSHDFSPSGKTMLDVLENAGLCINVARGKVKDGKLDLQFTIDEITGAKITGLVGKRGGLEKGFYEELNRDPLEKEGGFKIFMFHSLLTELKPKEMQNADSQPISLLPRNFNYYAGGHPHFVYNKAEQGYGMISYPGPLFPNNFSELEKLGNGGFYIYEEGQLSWEPVQIYNTYPIKLECDHRTVEQVESMLKDEIKDKEFINTIVTIRLGGVLETGKPSDIDFKSIIQMIYDKGAYFVMKNTVSLTTKEFDEIKIDADSVEDIEDKLIRENAGNLEITKELMKVLSTGRNEGEKVSDFEKRIKENVSRILNI